MSAPNKKTAIETARSALTMCVTHITSGGQVYLPRLLRPVECIPRRVPIPGTKRCRVTGFTLVLLPESKPHNKRYGYVGSYLSRCLLSAGERSRAIVLVRRRGSNAFEYNLPKELIR